MTPLELFTRFFKDRMESQNENHFSSLGLRFISADVGRAILELPYNPKLVANPANGAMGVGAIMALVDTTCAVAAATAMDDVRFCPTLDLRIDHLRQAEPGIAVRAEAEVYRKTRSVIFTRGIVIQNDRDKPIATCLVNFTPIDKPIVDIKKRVANNG